MNVEIFDPRNCALGEGPLWHPERAQLFWFDIIDKKLLSRSEETALSWQFETHVSAASWVSRDHLLIASETALFLFNLETGQQEPLCPLEADNPVTRSNDGRADPFGGFWIGTMGKNAEAHAGAIYRFYKGKLECLFSDITIPNSICFSPNGQHAYFTDTPSQKIMKQALDADGWPKGRAEPFIDLTREGLNPDGSVVDADGCLWNAQWGASRVARYAPDGRFLATVPLPAAQTTCPAFGSKDRMTLYVTSASDGITRANEDQGRTFALRTSVAGLPENRVIL